MNKPKSLSIKDFLIRKMSVKLNVPEKTIEAVVNHQFQSANAAMLTTKSIEFSGFGKFLFNEKKALKKLDKLMSKKEAFTRIANDEAQTEQRRISAGIKLQDTLKEIDIIKPKTNEVKSDLRGMEE